MLTNKKLIIFDLDGTLVDSAPDIAAAANAMRTEMGYPEQTLEQVKQWVGNGSAMLVKRALADVHGTDENGVTEQEFELGHQLFFKHYRLVNGRHSRLFPQVREALHQLKQQHHKLAVCTNKPKEFTDVLLQHFNLFELFDCIVGGDTLSTKKPDPKPILYCTEQCSVSVEESLMVGDSLTDINGASNADMDVVCVPYGYHRGTDLSQQSRMILNLMELC